MNTQTDWAKQDERRLVLGQAYDSAVADALADDKDIPEKGKELAELEQQIVLRVARVCGGPLYDEKNESARWKKWYSLLAKGSVKGVVDFIRALQVNAQKFAKPGFKVTLPHLPKGDPIATVAGWGELRRAAFPLIRLRGRKLGWACGRDFNEEVLAHPFDGGERESTCPDCGVVTKWKSPVF